MNKYANLDMNCIVENILKQLNLKNQEELAKKLNITKNGLSMIKRRNSIGTLIEKLFSIEEVISFDSMLYGTDVDEFKNQISNKIKNEMEELERKINKLKDKNDNR